METILKDMEERFGQIIALIWVFLNKLKPLNLSIAQLQDLIKNKEHPFWTAFDEAIKLIDPRPTVATDRVYMGFSDNKRMQVDFWVSFYKKHFNIDLDPSEIRFPRSREGFNWLIIVAKGVRLNRVWVVCKKHFECSNFVDNIDDIESIMQESERGMVPTTRAFWLRSCIEADEETKDVSAINQTEPSITLIVRCLLELKYFSETGKRLDLENITLCAGSRFVDDRVPDAFSGHESCFIIRWRHPGYRHPKLRARVMIG